MKEQEEKENQLKSRLGELEEELEKEKDENQKLQNKVKTELENQKDQLNQKLQDVEIKRKENKEEVQMVEKKITEKENYDNKDLLLGEKEKLLQSQWKLDKKKKHYERQLLNIEKVMEPIEIHMMRTKKKMRIFRK
ncbi:coiled-coil domain-containing protein 34-like isoform X2 [Xiphophorus hellerii]|uniref:coiled-coil domain-containing protein 34-like isoform X2 n=1 Tax=Xiphophorus hellerii TaxID=8084 RepID=UPI0013B3F6FB|nr:coiled-coil domain-containing protein 34-like isoform X2 [Xiphophorus hellerii]